jgi:hypothetical protein
VADVVPWIASSFIIFGAELELCIVEGVHQPPLAYDVYIKGRLHELLQYPRRSTPPLANCTFFALFPLIAPPPGWTNQKSTLQGLPACLCAREPLFVAKGVQLFEPSRVSAPHIYTHTQVGRSVGSLEKDSSSYAARVVHAMSRFDKIINGKTVCVVDSEMIIGCAAYRYVICISGSFLHLTSCRASQ